MSSEESTTLKPEPIHVNDVCRNGERKRTMKEQDRRMFIEYLFDQVKTLGALSKNKWLRRFQTVSKKPILSLN